MKEPNFQLLYENFRQLEPTQRNLLKRAVTPNDLFEIPAFYELYRSHRKEPEQRIGLLRLIFCLPFIKHKPEGKTLGAALAVMGSDGRVIISEKRLIQLSRIENNHRAMEQLRRLLKYAEPSMDWLKAGKSIWYWGKGRKRQMLEDYFMALPSKTKAK
jgi:CRISPR system Cascade subunit CasB